VARWRNLSAAYLATAQNFLGKLRQWFEEAGDAIFKLNDNSELRISTTRYAIVTWKLVAIKTLTIATTVVPDVSSP
jgi:hypothetical protein